MHKSPPKTRPAGGKWHFSAPGRKNPTAKEESVGRLTRNGKPSQIELAAVLIFPLLVKEKRAVTEPDNYLLGRSEAEEGRLKLQIANLAPDSDAQLEKIGIKPGERIVDLGCGPGGVLHLLGKRVGPLGSVVGIERSARFADLARRFVHDQALGQVEGARRRCL